MRAKNWLAALGLGLLLAAAGCVNCGHQACKPALEAGPNAEVPGCDRRHVYTVMVNGLTPGGSSPESLRMQLAERGYEKVYTGEIYHGWWLWREMKRVYAEDPSARFVLVGFDFGCGTVAGFARDAARHGMPVEAVVFLDPIGTPPVIGDATRSVVLRSSADTGEVVATALKHAAARIEHPASVTGAEIAFPDAPAPRLLPRPDPRSSGEWYFLLDQVGTHNVPLSPGVLPKGSDELPEAAIPGRVSEK